MNRLVAAFDFSKPFYIFIITTKILRGDEIWFIVVYHAIQNKSLIIFCLLPPLNSRGSLL